MEKFQEEKVHSDPYFFHFKNSIPLNFGQNSDGFEILVLHLLCRSLTKRENGLP
jgi:hypothetical protein